MPSHHYAQRFKMWYQCAKIFTQQSIPRIASFWIGEDLCIKRHEAVDALAWRFQRPCVFSHTMVFKLFHCSLPGNLRFRGASLAIDSLDIVTEDRLVTNTDVHGLACILDLEYERSLERLPGEEFAELGALKRHL